MTAGCGTALALCSLIVCTGLSCRQPEQQNVIARVGKETLTLDQARAGLGASGQPSEDELRRFINHWVSEELLFQEAQRRGLENTQDFDERMQETRRHLLAQAFLDSQFGDSSQIGDSILRAYYDQHADEFFVHADMMKLNALRFVTREKASQFAALITRGMTWSDAMAAALRDSADPATAIPGVSGQYVSQHSVFPPELWKVAASLGINELSFPVKTAIGYCVIQPLARLSAGSRAGFEVALDEIRARVRIEQRRRNYEELLGTLRKRYSVEIILPNEQKTDTLHNTHD